MSLLNNIKENFFTEKRREVAIVLLVFAAGIIIHFLIGNFTKALETYRDELIYFSQARSFISCL